eukprot:NODE_2808_length_2141_cov_5.960775.p1 GENE.NODE_2808_length_2141_cov_5.960775~~NODE_2808_length_2141_cov_5.960775.p1  ORF type:complete len:582 (+),score=147.63 NODE_2808_length_2141_cov_5.960775:223-1746(+)
MTAQLVNSLIEDIRGCKLATQECVPSHRGEAKLDVSRRVDGAASGEIDCGDLFWSLESHHSKLGHRQASRKQCMGSARGTLSSTTEDSAMSHRSATEMSHGSSSRPALCPTSLLTSRGWPSDLERASSAGPAGLPQTMHAANKKTGLGQSRSMPLIPRIDLRRAVDKPVASAAPVDMWFDRSASPPRSNGVSAPAPTPTGTSCVNPRHQVLQFQSGLPRATMRLPTAPNSPVRSNSPTLQKIASPTTSATAAVTAQRTGSPPIPFRPGIGSLSCSGVLGSVEVACAASSDVLHFLESPAAQAIESDRRSLPQTARPVQLPLVLSRVTSADTSAAAAARPGWMPATARASPSTSAELLAPGSMSHRGMRGGSSARSNPSLPVPTALSPEVRVSVNAVHERPGGASLAHREAHAPSSPVITHRGLGGSSLGPFSSGRSLREPCVSPNPRSGIERPEFYSAWTLHHISNTVPNAGWLAQDSASTTPHGIASSGGGGASISSAAIEEAAAW